jgi:hypothetical protein
LTRKDKNYDIIGGSDGEIFIINGKLLLFNIYNSYISHYFPKEDSPKLNDVIIAIKNLMSCYSFVKTTGPGITFKQIKEDAIILRLKNVNKFSAWLFDSVSRDIMNYNAIELQPVEATTNNTFQQFEQDGGTISYIRYFTVAGQDVIIRKEHEQSAIS